MAPCGNKYTGWSIDKYVMTRDNTINVLLETFQKCRQEGEWATLFLETRNGDEFANLKVKLPASHKIGTPGKTFSGSASAAKKIKPKSPSTIRRDRHRMETFLERKTLQESPRSPSATSTPISSPDQQTSFIEEVQVTMPVTEVLEELGVEQQIIQAEKEKDKDKVELNS